MGMFEDVRSFMLKFGQHIGDKPGFPDEKIVALRCNLIIEEYRELFDAALKRDLVETADAIADLIYVLIGTALAFGIDLRPVWEEVHLSNMSKSIDLKRNDGKIMKPEGWVKPDIQAAINDGDVLK
jgi:predicted HAD superfamily Cof-like phosphohydrolase